MPVFRHQHTVTADQIDLVGHLNNAAYLQVFEAARWGVLAELGVDTAALFASGVSPVIVAIELSFRREVRLGETITVLTEFEPLSSRRMVARQRMVDAAGTVRAVADVHSTFFDLRTRKAVAPPAEILRASGLDPADVPPDPIVQGVGGAFLYARDPAALAAWYREHLGLPMTDWDGVFGIELPSADRVPSLRVATTTFALFPFGGDLPSARTGRVNLRVGDLDGVLARLATAGITPEKRFETYGRFAWITDPEGNRLELWEPPRK